MQVKVTMRIGVCRCGCKGRDPWHARTMMRVVTETPVPVPAGTPVKGYDDVPLRADSPAGIITAPWGAQEVVKVGARWYRLD
jgi:hypothetical protein